MSFILEGIQEAFGLLLRGDGETYQIVGLTLVISLTATLLATLVGIPVGALAALGRFRGRSILGVFLHTSMAIPSVFLGLILYALFSRQGPLGMLGLTWLYTPVLMILGQALLAWPLMAALTQGVLERVDPRVYQTAVTVGASPLRAIMVVLRESRSAIGSAVAAGFARALTEVGCAWIVGGNIRGQTRVITTSVVYHTVRGEFGRSFALGLVLLIVALVVNLFIWRATRVTVQEG